MSRHIEVFREFIPGNVHYRSYLFLSHTTARHLGQCDLKKAPMCACDDVWTSELSPTSLFTPADLFIKQLKPPQTRSQVRFKGETFI